MGEVTILGFPLRVSPWLPIMLFVLGQGGGSLAGLVAFIVGGILAILVHELGHALAARWAGASDIEVQLVALGGLTTYSSQPQSRWARIGIAVAGPATGVVLGLPLLLARLGATDGTETARVLESLVFVTLGWAILNLLPVRPFDGGHVLESLLPGSEETRVRVASVISVGFALAVATFAWSRGSTWTAGVFVVVAAINVAGLLPGRAAGGSAEDLSYAVLGHVLAGDLSAAQQQAGGRRIDPAVTALVEALAPRAGATDGAERLPRLVADRPDPLRRACLLVLATSRRDWDGAIGAVAQGALPAEVMVWAMGAARTSRRPDVAAAMGQAALPWSRDPTLAYLTARCWGAAGRADRAHDALVYAARLGWDDLAEAADEPDLAGMRDLPSWAAFVQERSLQPRSSGTA